MSFWSEIDLKEEEQQEEITQSPHAERSGSDKTVIAVDTVVACETTIVGIRFQVVDIVR
jgi:hypothetical protein